MKLIYLDPNCTPPQVEDCESVDEIPKILAKAGCDEDSCGGWVIHWVFIDRNGQVTKGTEDYT